MVTLHQRTFADFVTQLYRLDCTSADIAQRFGARGGDDPWAGGYVAPMKFAPIITAGREYIAGPRPAGKSLQPRMTPRLWGVAPPPNAEDPLRRQPTRPAFALLGQPVITFVEASTHRPSRVRLLGDGVSLELAASLSAERLVDAGAILSMQTTAPEFYLAAVTWTELWGVTRNPWNLDYTPGGSSGGSGAALHVQSERKNVCAACLAAATERKVTIATRAA